MRPAQDPAVHSRLSTRAVATVIRIVTVDRIGNDLDLDPHGNTLPAIFPRYTAPARVSVVLKTYPLRPPESRTSHGPAAHLGVACHVSSQLLGPVRPAAPRVSLMLTVHGPCSRDAERGGVAVVTTMTGDRAERRPPAPPPPGTGRRWRGRARCPGRR